MVALSCISWVQVSIKLLNLPIPIDLSFCKELKVLGLNLSYVIYSHLKLNILCIRLIGMWLLIQH
jgi:hypothetical protein